MMNLQFGIALPYLDARTAARLAHKAEEAGWDGVFVGDAIWCEDAMVILTAMAANTNRIRLGTMIIPVPLRRPWKIASESIALERFSGGRLTLGLGAGAVWMGWQAFPNEITDKRARTEMLDETIDILDLLYQRKQADYLGKHYQLKLTELDEQYYPPPPIQQPRIPLWVVGIWPRMKSMHRVLKCDGLLPQKMNPAGELVELTPEDVSEMKAYIDTNRTRSTPFDIVVEGQTGGMPLSQAQEKVAAWAEAGATWWIEGMWGRSVEEVSTRIQQGPPR
ncbi:MAG TPA: LLM class flavin-dependent oxidoreductase [Anaerolineales bacterium]|nr:LLM class flavin-dependent oxidoreductase [Anaerolineales bacterium]